MAPTNYQRGRQFEYRTRDKLLKQGAAYVMRAASSKGAADLIALWPSRERETLSLYDLHMRPIYKSIVVDHGVRPPWLVQCKRDGKLPKPERTTLLDLAVLTGAVPVLARVPKSGRGVEFVNLNTKEIIDV